MHQHQKYSMYVIPRIWKKGTTTYKEPKTQVPIQMDIYVIKKINRVGIHQDVFSLIFSKKCHVSIEVHLFSKKMSFFEMSLFLPKMSFFQKTDLKKRDWWIPRDKNQLLRDKFQEKIKNFCDKMNIFSQLHMKFIQIYTKCIKLLKRII